MSIGKMGTFDVANDDWDLYVDRLEQYFVANDIKPMLKVATLITVIGSEAYELMVNLCTPEKPSAKTYGELVAVMKNHLQPRPSMLAERFKFRQRIQQEGESVAEYAAELKRLSKDCQFAVDSLKENLRDQFVCGLLSDSIRQKLFTEDDIKFDVAFKIAMAMEAAGKQSRHYSIYREHGPPLKRHIDQIRRGSQMQELQSLSDHPSTSSSVNQPGIIQDCLLDTERTRSHDTQSPPSNRASRGDTSEVNPPLNVPRITLRPRDTLRPVLRYGIDE